MFKRIVAGVSWGITILVLSVFLGAAGHGMFAPLVVFAAPVSLLGAEWAWLSCVPIAIFLAVIAPRREFPFVVGVHYLGAIAAAGWSKYADWERLWLLPAEFTAMFGLTMSSYVLGHLLLWRTWLRRVST